MTSTSDSAASLPQTLRDDEMLEQIKSLRFDKAQLEAKLARARQGFADIDKTRLLSIARDIATEEMQAIDALSPPLREDQKEPDAKRLAELWPLSDGIARSFDPYWYADTVAFLLGCVSRLSAAREAVLEEAAKIVDGFMPEGPDPIGPLHGAGRAFTAVHAAKMIRCAKSAAGSGENGT